MFIRSERLFLRPGWEEDRAELAALGAAGRTDCTIGCTPWFDLAVDLANPRPGAGLPRFVITLPGPHGARLVGLAALERAGDNLGIGVWIAPAHRGLGYAAETVRALQGMARALGHTRLVACPALDCACDDDPEPTLRAA
jgi:RimJ/RimL family protein N-acetyltransferase